MKYTLPYCQGKFVDYAIVMHFFNAQGRKLEKTLLGLLRLRLYQLFNRNSLLCEQFIPMFSASRKA